MARHEQPEHDDDDDDRTEDTSYSPTIGDVVTRWHYTLSPTLYVDENSSTSDLLWQQVLEQRAVRHWLALIWWSVFGGLVLAAVLLVVLLPNR